MLRDICLALLILPGATLSAAEKTVVTQRLEDRRLTFGPGLDTQFEGLTLALLGSCSAETTFHVGKKENWDKALKGDHVLVKYPKPRLISVNHGEDGDLEAQEILVPIGPNSRPGHIFVRNGDRFRTFSKYEFVISEAYSKQLQRMLPLPPKPPTQ